MSFNFGHHLTSPPSLPLSGSTPSAGIVSRRMGRGLSGLIIFLTFFSLLLSATVLPAAAGTLITNIANVYSQSKNLSSARNDAVFVVRTPSVIELLRYSSVGELQPFSQSEYQNSAGQFVLSPPAPLYAGGPLLNPSEPVPLSASELFIEADTIFVRLADPDQNLYADQIESVLVTLTSSTGDSEVLRLYETAINSGLFVGYITSTAAPVTSSTDNNGSLSIAPEGSITARYTDIADFSDASVSAGLFDPVGTVFDSTTGLPVDGVTISIVDMAGNPAQVFGDDGATYPSEVVSGGSTVDSNGRIYTFPPGGYRFPLMNVGNYRLLIQPPADWSAPSTVSTMELQLLPGAPWSILEPGSRGEPFALAPVPILRLDIPIDPISEGLWVAKSAAKSVIAIGDFLPYQIMVTNTSKRGNALDVVVTDHLPRGFRYLSGSARLDGVRIANPAISADGHTLSFPVGAIASLQSKTLTYVVEVATGAVPGEAVNRAAANGQGGITSNTAKASVKVTEDLFRSSSLIVGQVLDGCGAEAQGISGVRIYLEDGTFVITDQDGLYHFEGVRPIAHVVQLDTVTLPSGYNSVACEDNTRFAGQNFSQFVELQGGTMWRSDFYVSKPPEFTDELSGSGMGPPSPAVTGSTELTLTSTIIDRQVRYQVEIGNKLVASKNLQLTLNLPTALSPTPGSVVIDDLAAGDPELVGDVYIFGLGDQQAGDRHLLHFETEIPESAAGEMMATAVLRFDSETVDEQRTPDAVNRFMVTRTTEVDRKDFVMTTHFDSGRADLNLTDKQAINDFSQAIKGWQIEKIEVIGHTDNLPLTARTARLFRDNLGLSVARAATVAAALTAKLNLPAEKIVSHGKGEGEFIGDNRRAAGRAANRRVEIKVWLSKDRIDTTIDPLQMDSGPQQVMTEAAALLQTNTSDDLHSTTLLTTETAVATSNPENGVGFLSPLDGTVLATPISAVRVRIESRLKPLLLLNGIEIPAERIGFTMVDKESKSTLYSYIGVNFGDPGEHKLVLRGVDPFGNARFEKSATIIRTGAVTAIRCLEDGKNIADGKTPVRLRVELRDASGQVIPAGISLTLKGGNLQPPRADAPLDLTIMNNELQVKVDRDGWVEFRPVSQSGAYRTTLLYNEDVSVDVETYVMPELRDWILVGLAEGTVGYNTVASNLQSLTAAEQNEDYYDDGRIAFFAKGKIKGEWLLTAAYDTGKPKIDKLHGTIDPDQYYTLYGDGTDQQYDAASARKLYVKLERGQFYALFGDYDTGLTVTELARYSRSLNGFKSELKNRYFSYNAFASETNQALIRDEIPGDGTSGLYRLSRRDLLINSEKIVIETRDRFHSEIIIASLTLSRHVDYDIDYDAGTLFFKEPIASRDASFNPIMIVIDYEARDDRDAAMNYGGRGALRLGENVEVGASYIHEGARGAEGSLTAVDTKVKFGQTEFRAEVATSQVEIGIAPTAKGDAYLAELSHHGQDLDGRVYIRKQESGFGLGQQRSSEAGSRKLGSDARYRLNDKFSVMGEVSRQSMLDTGAERDLGQAEIKYQEKDYSLRTGLRLSSDRTATGDINRSTQFLIGGNQQVSKRLNLRLNHDQAIFSKDDSADYPTRTLLGLDYLITEKVAVFLEQEFTSSDAQDSNMTRAGLKASPWSGAQMQSTIQQQGSENGPRVFATTGLKQTWQLNEPWSVDAGLDRSQTLRHPGSTPVNGAAPPASGSAEDFTALSFGANRKAEKWTFSNRIEYRTSDSEDKLSFYSGAEGEVRHGLALSGRFQFFDNQRSGGSHSRDGNLRLGAAYRPVETRWILLDRLDYLFDREETSTNDFSNWRLVNNLNANFRPNRQTQLSFQYGAKYVQENIDGRNYNSFTDLIGLEARHDLTRKWDIGVQGQVLHSWQAQQSDYRLAPSVGYLLMKNMWLSGGYNLVGFQDADFSAADFTAQGPFVKFRFKFDQNSVRDAMKQL